MRQLLGEYDVKLDAKSRVRLPSQLLKKLGDQKDEAFVINRGLDKCLMLYPKKVWDVITTRVNRLNTYNKKNREFVRFFYRGATEVELDSSERILVNKRLLEYAGIEKEVILFAVNDRIEIWSQQLYDAKWNVNGDDYSDLAQEVLGDDDDPATGGLDIEI